MQMIYTEKIDLWARKGKKEDKLLLTIDVKHTTNKYI